MKFLGSVWLDPDLRLKLLGSCDCSSTQQGHTWLQGQSSGQTSVRAAAEAAPAAGRLTVVSTASDGELMLLMRLAFCRDSFSFFLPFDPKRERNFR